MGDILDVFYFIGYAESAVSRLKVELSKLPLDPERWNKTDRKYINGLAMEAARALEKMAGLCEDPMTDEELAERLAHCHNPK